MFPGGPGGGDNAYSCNQLRKLNFALLNAYYARNTVPTASPTDQGRPNFQLSPRQPQPAAGSNKVQCSSNKQPHLRARIRGGELLCRGGYGRCLVPPRAPQYDTVGFNLFVTSSSTPHSDLTPLPHTTYNSVRIRLTPKPKHFTFPTPLILLKTPPPPSEIKG